MTFAIRSCHTIGKRVKGFERSVSRRPYRKRMCKGSSSWSLSDCPKRKGKRSRQHSSSMSLFISEHPTDTSTGSEQMEHRAGNLTLVRRLETRRLLLVVRDIVSGLWADTAGDACMRRVRALPSTSIPLCLLFPARVIQRSYDSGIQCLWHLNRFPTLRVREPVFSLWRSALFPA